MFLFAQRGQHLQLQLQHHPQPHPQPTRIQQQQQQQQRGARQMFVAKHLARCSAPASVPGDNVVNTLPHNQHAALDISIPPAPLERVLRLPTRPTRGEGGGGGVDGMWLQYNMYLQNSLL